MQQRLPPGRARPRVSRMGNPVMGGAALSGIGTMGRRTGDPSRPRSAGRLAALPALPPRSTKVSEKLVLLPETVLEEEEEEEDETLPEVIEEEMAKVGEGDAAKERLRRLLAERRLRGREFGVDNELAPLLAEEDALMRRMISPEKAKSYAERLPKARRADKLPRVTAYCTAQGYKLSSTATFVKDYHGARTKLYDDCLYTAYHLPLLPGRDGYRIRSSPILRSAEGKVVLDEEIARNEQRDYHEEYYAEQDEHSVKDHGLRSDRLQDNEEHHQKSEDETYGRSPPRDQGYDHDKNEMTSGEGASTDGHRSIKVPNIPPNALAFAEMFVFSYGVVVFWNFSERQEIDVLADLAFASDKEGIPIQLATNPLPEEDFETEEFHFDYSTEISRPRVYNDMITLRSGDHMIKLAISHGIAQSTKLSFFEEVMAKQMSEAKDVPRRLALTGHLGMKREEVFQIMGRLFKSRVEVNLCKFFTCSSQKANLDLI